MNLYFKTIAGVLLGIILIMVLAKQGKDVSVLLGIAVCCMITAVVGEFLQPVIHFFEVLQVKGNIDTELFEIILKSVCVGLLGEVISLLCADSGNAALGKGVHMLTVTVILWISLPMLNELLSLVDEILGAV